MTLHRKHFSLAIRRALGLLILMVGSVLQATAEPLEFTLHEITGAQAGPTLLVIGGIQGDEPGGFNAASLLVTHYRLLNGAVRVVPNLNFESIVRRSRGVHGDMNRKFSQVSQSDPDYARVERIKAIITDEQVDYVLNLHDGSGFYRPEHVDSLHSPRRWGQSVIIDQNAMPQSPHLPLASVALRVCAQVNKLLIDPQHRLHVKNTRTREGNVEMAKTLTYFAINQGKPAIGIEASKSLPTHLRVYYHLQIVEAYMRELGIGFERRFALTPKIVRRTVDENINVAFYDDRMTLDFANARGALRYFPMQEDAELRYQASSPLVAILNSKDGYRVSYGNRRITRLQPQFFKFDSSLKRVSMIVDGTPQDVEIGSVVDVNSRFEVQPRSDLRVNVIGWRRSGAVSEAGFKIVRSEIARRFSIDRAARIYRVEFYRGEQFAGMVLVRFVGNKAAANSSHDIDLAPAAHSLHYVPHILKRPVS